MHKKIEFSLESTLGDTASSAFHGIKGLNCFEYTLWQLLRQNGIWNYYAALNTKAFLTEPRNLDQLFTFRPILYNMKRLEENMNEFYGIVRVPFQEYSKPKHLHTFVTETIHKEKFLYTLYNNYFNTINNKMVRPKRHEIHCTLITGYDDYRKEYIPLVDGIYNIGYEDILRMSEDFKRMPDWLFSWSLFYLSEPTLKNINKEDFKVRILKDFECMISDWGKEIEIFEQGIDLLKDRFSVVGSELDSEKSKELWKISFTLHNIQIGLEGNLYLKIKALQEVTGLDLNQFYADFNNSRSKVKTIANIIAKLALDYSYEKLLDTLYKLKVIFIDEAQRLRQQLYKQINALKGTGLF